MHYPSILRAAAVVCLAGIANARYVIQDTYDHTNFFDAFNFFDSADPTHGFVDYVSAATANQSALAGYSNGGVYMGVDYTTMRPSGGRASVRVESKKTYTRGLFLADIAHMPSSTCGTWPAFWTVGGNWPAKGEIDIIEGVHSQRTNIATLHTSPGCTMSNTGSLVGTTMKTSDCNANTAFTGCSQGTNLDGTIGSGFNDVFGGVYAMEWTHDAINIWFFPRNWMPPDVGAANPDPSHWGAPQARFVNSGCDIDAHFQDHRIVFDTTFCGDWAGAPEVWGASCAAATRTATCQQFVAENPAAFKDAYWLINSVKVFSQDSSGKRDLVPRPFMA